MSAQSLEVVTLAVPNPEWINFDSSNRPERVNDSLGFHFITSFNIRTLSPDGANRANDITGFLYVPDIESTDPCVNASVPYIPQNATRQANLPQTDYDLIAIAPWFDPQCSLKFMEAARADPTRGFLFFRPGNSTATPSDRNDEQWNIPGAGNWKSHNGFPVYAIPGQSGGILLEATAQYSGNMTDVPNGHELTGYFNPRDYVRLYADINTGSGTTLPSLWVFLLVVLGILVGIIGITSLCMHLLQRRRRQSLRRRVRNGEVDLEALGIKRLTVPQDLLNEMPLYVYGSGVPASRTATNASDTGLSGHEEKATGSAPSANVASKLRPAQAPRTTSYHPTPLSQPTCPICLDDFVPATAEEEGTTVRELPCHHIFHPECVDTFLRDSSSLCPMCKKTALPQGYCPRVITNAMVRRERNVRQLRQRIIDDPNAVDAAFPPTLSQRVRSMAAARTAAYSRRFSRPHNTGSQQMTQFSSGTGPGIATSQAPLTTITSQPPESRPSASQVQPPATESHRTWAQQRAENMLGQRAPDDPEAEEARTTPAWRKALHGMFPRR